jgi:prepilin-type N-terminal cleavage/methylation domain-containing protein
MQTGYTLLELAIVLTIAGILLLLATPGFGPGRDVLATRAARDHLLAQIALARVLAPAHGGAEVVLDTASARVVVRAGARVYSEASLQQHFGVRLGLAGQAPGPVVLRFDAIGLGRMSSRTITLSRGDASGHVSISAYGRARAW